MKAALRNHWSARLHLRSRAWFRCSSMAWPRRSRSVSYSSTRADSIGHCSLGISDLFDLLHHRLKLRELFLELLPVHPLFLGLDLGLQQGGESCGRLPVLPLELQAHLIERSEEHTSELQSQ